MTITTTTLTRAAGLAAVAGGPAVHRRPDQAPLLDAAFTTTTEYGVRETAEIVIVVSLAHRHHRDLPAPGPERSESSA